MPISRVVRTHTTLRTSIVGVSCNVCGKEATLEGNRPGWPMGFHEIALSGGYGDEFPGDLERLEFVTCDDCLRKWVESFQNSNVFVDAGMARQPLPAMHSESWTPVVVFGHLVLPEGTTQMPEGAWSGDFELNENLSVPHDATLWEHYKGNRYMVHGVVYHWPSREPMVHYQALYGDSVRIVRPLSMWFDEVQPDTPRFKFIDPG